MGLVRVVVLLVALLFLSVGVGLAWRWTASRSWPTVQGTVVEVRRRLRSGGDGPSTMTYNPVVAYLGPDGTEQTYDGETTSSRRYRVGQQVRLRVHPTRPGTAVLSQARILVLAVVVVVFSLALIGVDVTLSGG